MKKNSLILACLASSLLLVGCSKAGVSLKNPDEPVVTDKNGVKVEVEANTIKEIFNSIKLGDNFESDIASMLTEELAKSYIGDYRIDKNGKIYIEGLNENDNNAVFEFVQAHKFYWNWTSTGVSVEYEEEPSMANIEDYKARINQYKTLVEKEVVKKIYEEANVSDNKKNNRFYEILYARSIYGKLYPIYKKDGSKVEATDLYTKPDFKNFDDKENNAPSYNNDFTCGKLIDRNYNVDDNYKAIIEGDTALIHLYHYTDYINETIIPGIINNLLTQSYVYEKQYQAIGRTQSRKLNFIKLEDSGTSAEKLLKTFAETELKTLTESNVDFTVAVEAWNGIHDELNSSSSSLNSTIKNKANQLAEITFGKESTDIKSEFKTYIDGKTGEDYPYYIGSMYGNIIQNYSKLTNNPATNDSSTYSDFTTLDGLKYSPEEGLKVKVDNLKTTSYVTNKWGGSSSFSDIGDSTMTSKLFSYGLSNEFETAKNPDTTFIVDGAYLKQFTKGGPTFLKKTTYSNEFDSIVWKSTNSHYIVEVVDQISPDTLASGSDATKDELKEIEEKAIDMAYTLSSSSTYTNNAITYFLKNSNINYYDEDVYEYFKSTYPSLFED